MRSLIFLEYVFFEINFTRSRDNLKIEDIHENTFIPLYIV